MKIITGIIVSAFIITACSLNSNNSDEPAVHVDKFFEKYKHESPAAALDYIYSDQLIQKDDNLIATIEDMKQQLTDAEDFLGGYFDKDHLNTKEKGSSIKSYSYLARYEMQPLLFIFIFYKPDDQWKLHHFNYSDNVDQKILDEMREL